MLGLKLVHVIKRGSRPDFVLWGKMIFGVCGNSSPTFQSHFLWYIVMNSMCWEVSSHLFGHLLPVKPCTIWYLIELALNLLMTMKTYVKFVKFRATACLLCSCLMVKGKSRILCTYIMRNIVSQINAGPEMPKTWFHNVETLSTVLAFCERNPLIIEGFPTQRASNKGRLYFRCW